MSDSTTTNRRKHDRKATYLPIRIFAHSLEISTETLSKDFGAGGLRCLTRTATPAQTLYTVEIALPKTRQILTLRAKQAWLHSIPESDQFEMGIEFLDINEPDRRILEDYQQHLAGLS